MDKFTEGFWYGRLHGQASPRQADAYLRRMHGIGARISTADIDLFCNGASDGAQGDYFRLNMGPFVYEPCDCEEKP